MSPSFQRTNFKISYYILLSAFTFPFSPLFQKYRVVIQSILELFVEFFLFFVYLWPVFGAITFFAFLPLLWKILFSHLWKSTFKSGPTNFLCFFYSLTLAATYCKQEESCSLVLTSSNAACLFMVLYSSCHFSYSFIATRSGLMSRNLRILVSSRIFSAYFPWHCYSLRIKV